MKHTPGPWEIERCENEGRWIIIRAPHMINSSIIGNSIACMDDRAYCHVGDEQMLSDARLIAAAPEMLEALIELYDDWKHIEYTDPDIAIKPVIEKATNKTWEALQEES